MSEGQPIILSEAEIEKYLPIVHEWFQEEGRPEDLVKLYAWEHLMWLEENALGRDDLGNVIFRDINPESGEVEAFIFKAPSNDQE